MPDFNQIWISRQICVEVSCIKFHGNPYSKTRADRCRQTGAFSVYENAPETAGYCTVCSLTTKCLWLIYYVRTAFTGGVKTGGDKTNKRAYCILNIILSPPQHTYFSVKLVITSINAKSTILSRHEIKTVQQHMIWRFMFSGTWHLVKFVHHNWQTVPNYFLINRHIPKDGS